MQRRGVHHLGLATLDIDRTIDFYTNKLGWEVGWCDMIEVPGGGKIKHVFLNTGDGTFFAFMSPEKVPGLPEEFATDINSAQNLPSAFYHFAMWLDSTEELEAKRKDLLAKGVDVTVVVDHEWCHSIYFKDPNGLQLEYCVTTRKFDENDKVWRHHDQPGPMTDDPAERKKMNDMLMGRGKPPQMTRTPV